MNPDRNRETIRRLYEALDRHDGDAMAARYAPSARFRDPAFGLLAGEQVGDMWRMLTARSEDLRVDLVEHDADEQRGSARWIATYTFSPTGRSVRNDVSASFRFEGGRIAEHTDRFSFHRWSSQALGPLGTLLGWTPVLRLVFRRQARKNLARFAARARSGLPESAKTDEDPPPGS